MFGLESFGNGRGLTGLPDNRVVNRATGFLVPNDRSFALIGDTDSRDVRRVKPRTFQSFLHDGNHCAPDFVRVVFDPAGFREMLREFSLRYADDFGIFVEDDGAIAGCAGVESHYVFFCH